MTKQPTCEDRIEEHLENRLDYIEKRLKWYHAWYVAGNYDRSDQALQALQEFPLGIEIKKVLIIELGTGGPADYFEVELDRDNEPVKITYHFVDWWDHAERNLTKGQEELVTDFIEATIPLDFIDEKL